MVAGVDLDLVAGEVAQVGDDGILLSVDSDNSLGAFKGFLILAVRDPRTPGRAGGRREEVLCPVGNSHHRAPLSRVSRHHTAKCKRFIEYEKKLANWRNNITK